MVRAVLFDLFETLITESRTRPAGVSSLGPELGCEREAFRAEWKARRPAVTVGRLPFRQALSDIATGLGSHAEDAVMRRVCDERIRIKAEAFEQIEHQILMMLGHLRGRGLRLGIVSNCFAEDVVAWPQCSLASCFDCSVFSFEVGLAKPDPEIYLEATRRLRVDVSDTWFIGDGMHEELSGSEQAGLRAFRALWFLRRWPHFRDEPSAGASLASVEEVVSVVEQSMGPPYGRRSWTAASNLRIPTNESR
jgi:putative hydrolase of the HAD superfamily